MKITAETIGKHISDRTVRFVFPSQTASDLWARKTCVTGIIRSVAANRFLAWDRFKEEITGEKEKEPAAKIMRRIFAESLARKNSESTVLKSVIPEKYRETGAVFAPYIARILPSLGQWEKLKKSAANYSKSRVRPDSEDDDFGFIKKEYEKFLERFGLFEPSWEEININEGLYSYVIFFPELIEDFSEYEALLDSPRFIKIRAASVPDSGQQLLHYKSARDEIRSAVIEIQRLHNEKNIPFAEMAVSVPDLETTEPYLLKEFHLRHIPVTRRAGRPLGETGAGRLFGLINECAAARFSFSSVKALLLDDHVPWKSPDLNRDLIEFGIEYNCVAGYVQDGREEDIWEEAFGRAKNEREKELRKYYYDLKKSIRAFCGSKSFGEIRKNYFTFRHGAGRNGFLDMEKISAENNEVLGRCIEELSTLIELEERLDDPELVPASPFAFFISCLDEKEYVRANQNPGVNVFRWRVAAAAPFRCHFVLNASQSAASVLYQPMKFLRQDKRKALGLEDTEATGDFFKLCRVYADTDAGGEKNIFNRISYSSQAFSGWAIPHSFFAQGKISEAPPCPPEPYGAERFFWRNTGSDRVLGKIYPLQKKSFENWKKIIAGSLNGFSFFVLPVPDENKIREILKNALPGEGGLLTVSPSIDLNVFYQCPVLWLFRRIFKTEKFNLEAALLDDAALGILYHRILESLFRKISEETLVFEKQYLEKYKQWAFEITVDEIKKEQAFRGPIAIPLVSSQAAGMAKKINRLLETEAKNLNGCAIAELEMNVNRVSGNLNIKGIIDRVSVTPDGIPVIIDYKTGIIPAQINPDEINEKPLSEFQMPVYIKLYEDEIRRRNPESNVKVGRALFFSINQNRTVTVVGEKSRANSNTVSREDYVPVLEAAEKQISEFGIKAAELDFAPQEIRVKDCLECDYKTACRTSYFLNAPAVKEKKPIQKGQP